MFKREDGRFGVGSGTSVRNDSQPGNYTLERIVAEPVPRMMRCFLHIVTRELVP